MKIGCLTWWRRNYGSILQAYALQTVINSIDNVDCEIICQYTKKALSFDNLLDKFKQIGFSRTISRCLWKFSTKKLRQRNRKIQLFIDKNIKISDNQYNTENIYETNNIYDGFICGSDQIWKYAVLSLSSIYWLSFVDESKFKLAYAPSLGLGDLNNREMNIIRQSLVDFPFISCREKTGTLLINSALKENRCITVLDPTIIIDKKIWDVMSEGQIIEQPYIFVYLLEGTMKQRKVVKKFAAKKNLKILNIPFLNSNKISLYDFIFGDIKFWDAAPDEFIKLIRNAEYVFTDSYHCTIFSCIYHKKFFTFHKVAKAETTRITDFLKMLEIKNRMITENISIKEIEDIEMVNWDLVDSIIYENKQISLSYLLENIKKWQRKRHI